MKKTNWLSEIVQHHKKTKQEYDRLQDLLNEAVKRGNKKDVLLLKRKGASLSASWKKRTPLAIALERDDLDMYAFLKSQGASIHTKIHQEQDLLWFALFLGNQEIFNELLEAGLNVNQWVQSSTLLIEAVKNSDLESVRRLILYGANLHAKDEKGWMPIHHNLYKTPYTETDRDIGYLLMEVGANAMAKTNDNIPAYAMADNKRAEMEGVLNLNELPSVDPEVSQKLHEMRNPNKENIFGITTNTVKMGKKIKPF